MLKMKLKRPILREFHAYWWQPGYKASSFFECNTYHVHRYFRLRLRSLKYLCRVIALGWLKKERKKERRCIIMSDFRPFQVSQLKTSFAVTVDWSSL